MDFMKRALRMARRAVGTCTPNPSVGAVVVRDGEIIAEGFTLPPGMGHAEAVALRKAGVLAKGATLYCTLEPCAHYGRVPPCTKAVIEAGIAEVHMAMIDPNPRVNGRGKAELEAAGIRCMVGEHEREAMRLIEAYARHITTGKPFVTAKFAMTLDGKMATRAGDSKWITGERARVCARTLRRSHDVVMVGIGTVLADDPLLTARDARGRPHRCQPVRVVVDSRGRIRASAKLLRQPGRTIIATTDAGAGRLAKLESETVEVQVLPSRDGHVDLAMLMEWLGGQGVTGVLAEGGGTLLGALFDARLVDKVAAFVAPSVVGGHSAPSPVEGMGVSTMSEALHLRDVEMRKMGEDIVVIGYVASGGSQCSAES
jgi:diaminohydroxyphosphoribosylaminopyrimidine deaminase/5-amino-6-(5-phosphoribosylamino)uracil reductase